MEKTLDEAASISIIARRNGVAPNLLYRWRRLMLEVFLQFAAQCKAVLRHGLRKIKATSSAAGQLKSGR